MGLLDCASGASVWRGYDYYKEKKVMNLIETDSGIFTADVIGTASERILWRLTSSILKDPDATVLTLTEDGLSAST